MQLASAIASDIFSMAHPRQAEVRLRLLPVLVAPLNDAAVQLNLAAAPAHLRGDRGEERG